MRNNVTIRMGAAYYDARVKVNGSVVTFDLSQMDKLALRKFRVELVKAFREYCDARK